MGSNYFYLEDGLMKTYKIRLYGGDLVSSVALTNENGKPMWKKFGVSSLKFMCAHLYRHKFGVSHKMIWKARKLLKIKNFM
jgi:hypothetical protein